MAEHCACERQKQRDTAEKTALIHRLNRIEGQIRGIRAMIERDTYCPDVLTQAAAASAALNSFAKAMLAEHIRTCVVQDIHEGKDDAAEELIATMQKFMK